MEMTTRAPGDRAFRHRFDLLHQPARFTSNDPGYVNSAIDGTLYISPATPRLSITSAVFTCFVSTPASSRIDPCKRYLCFHIGSIRWPITVRRPAQDGVSSGEWAVADGSGGDADEGQELFGLAFVAAVEPAAPVQLSRLGRVGAGGGRIRLIE